MTRRPDRRSVYRLAAATVAAIGFLSPRPAVAQMRVVIEGGVVVIGAGQEVARPAGGDRPVEAAAETAIGDPWWDDANDEPVAMAPPAAAGRSAQARLTAVRRSRGLQILRRELSRVRAACPNLDPTTRAAILAAGREAVEGQAAGRLPLVDGVEAALELALQDRAGAVAAKAYRAELEASAVRRRAAALAVLVEAIDRDAVLDDEARRRLADTLRRAWRPEWETVVTSAARRPLVGLSLPAGVVDAAATALDAETVAGWRQRAEEGMR